MKNKLLQTLLLLITLGLLLTSISTQVSALETSNNDTPPASGTSAGTIRIDFYVNNTIEKTVNLSFGDITAMPKTIVYADLSCYGELLQSGNWGGVSLWVLLEKAGFTGKTADIMFYASDGYTVPYSVSGSSPNDVIIAYELDGAPLPETLRLVVPGANGEAWISMITTMLINSPLYAYSLNPQAASVTLNQPTLQQSSTPSSLPSPPPKIKDPSTPQPTTKPTTPPSTNQPIQQSPPSLNTQIKYYYLIPLGIIVLASVAIGSLFYRFRK
jgi:hypothetical protein